MPESETGDSSLKFGTSGLRGLVVDLVGQPTRQWTEAFLMHLERRADFPRLLLVGRDLRASSPQISSDCLSAAAAMGWEVADCGALPTPALALAALARKSAAIMVTGSHIPDDRNGLKFYAPSEINKDDEVAIRALFENGLEGTAGEAVVGDVSAQVLDAYRRRYLDAFSPDALAGLTVGIYQHSSVARDLLVELLQSLGADTVRLARSESFIPVDTEAHRPEDVALLREWAGANRFDAIVSTDGDADRPLVADAMGEIVRGDLLGLLTASTLGLRTIVTPVTSSAAMETSNVADEVIRTKVGSPFVIEGMERAYASGRGDVLGFEANGGALLGSDVKLANGMLHVLPTRDAVLPILCVLSAIRSSGRALRDMVDGLGAGHALADRLKDVSSRRSLAFLTRLAHDSAYAKSVMADAGEIAATDDTDGLRFILDDGSVVHFRASGNAPELRCYVESLNRERAEELLDWGLRAAGRALAQAGVSDR